MCRATLDIERLGDVLARRRESAPIYTAAFILATPAYGHAAKHRNHLALVDAMFKPGKLAKDLAGAASLQAVYEDLLRWSGLGGFMAYQIAVDSPSPTRSPGGQVGRSGVGKGLRWNWTRYYRRRRNPTTRAATLRRSRGCGETSEAACAEGLAWAEADAPGRRSVAPGGVAATAPAGSRRGRSCACLSIPLRRR